MPNTQEIIDHKNLLVDDDTTFSEGEELIVANKIYRKIFNSRPWSWLVTTFTSTTSTSVPYIDLPANFKKFIPFDGYDNGRYSIFVGDDSVPYRLISLSDSFNYGNYHDADGYFYLDSKNRRLYFTKQPTEAKTVTFPYVYRPDDLTPETEPVFDEDYHYAISHGMVSDYYIADQTPKGRTYYGENEAKFDEMLQQMIMDDELLTLT
jgi:hypothetical protein